MNKKICAPVVLIILLLVLTSVPGLADEAALSLESKVIESFEDDPVTGESLLSRWIVRPSKFVKTYMDFNDNQEKLDVRIARVNTWPQALHGKNKEDLPLYSLGITTSFTRKGYNYLEIIPAREFDPEKDVREYIDGKDDKGDIVFTKCDKQWVSDTDKIIYTDQAGKRWVSDPLLFEGRVKALSTWVWGSNYNYYFEVHLEDHRSVVHVLPMGELTFSGWKNLTIDIPPSIPQAEKYIPKLKRLKLLKFMVWTRPNERVSGFYIYLDQIKTLSDFFETRYDGDDLEDPESIQAIWGECY
jgi:predicted RNA-binding protein